MNIQILLDDTSFIVINKPAGITVNKSDTTKNEMTVQEWVEDHIDVSNGVLSDTSDTFSSFDTFRQRGGIVHRLDKETSGILIIAKTPEAFENLQSQFK